MLEIIQRNQDGSQSRTTITDDDQHKFLKKVNYRLTGADGYYKPYASWEHLFTPDDILKQIDRMADNTIFYENGKQIDRRILYL